MLYLRLLQVFFKVSLLNELAYRANFWVQLFETLISFGTAAGGLLIIFSHTDHLGGWRPAELVMLLGVYFIMVGLIRVTVRPSLERLMADVREGTLDYRLTKPASSQFLVSFREMHIWRVTDLLLGIGLLVAGGTRLGVLVEPAQMLAFPIALIAGAAIIYSVHLVLATLTFWVVRTENIMVIFTSLFQAGRYPVGLYPTWLRAILTFIVPVAFATTVPTEALAGRLSLSTLLTALGVAVALLVVSAAFWRFGLRHYTGASA